MTEYERRVFEMAPRCMQSTDRSLAAISARVDSLSEKVDTLMELESRRNDLLERIADAIELGNYGRGMAVTYGFAERYRLTSAAKAEDAKRMHETIVKVTTDSMRTEKGGGNGQDGSVRA